MQVTIYRLPHGAWRQLRDLRLEALQESPSAFWATWEDESRYDVDDWTRFASNVAWFVANVNGGAVGLLGAVQRSDCTGEREIIGMWVRPVSRGQGVARLLVAAASRWAAGHGADALTLWVASSNHHAREFYVRLGFSMTGEEAPMPGGRRESEARMRRTLAQPPDS